ncbi:YflJ family protein [Bacillus thuringiensis]|uniref:YflJ family protein n=1 Tax=Bacillus thuringiensis TaxID=1428 RepID=A0AAW9GKH4_BACTU|nr:MULTISPECIES: YflJ family protein [Bacillus cereus group]MCC3688947.1 YflJ family protein [Bacillus cereus]MCH5458209.1 YflJ family protein [Bacillus cereus]MDA2092284.1 YflJ family protein [Bacillus cereus]MDA2412580.1 YflJ family protein [Bacillus cereus]MDF9621871.1 YflJ family protein [Bacillus cereus]
MHFLEKHTLLSIFLYTVQSLCYGGPLDTTSLIIFNVKLLRSPTYTVQKQKGSDPMYYGTKGWYVAELKKLGVRYHEGRKLESYRGHVLRNLLIAQQEKLKEQ